jgi:hypothetical protein
LLPPLLELPPDAPPLLAEDVWLVEPPPEPELEPPEHPLEIAPNMNAIAKAAD